MAYIKMSSFVTKGNLNGNEFIIGIDGSNIKIPLQSLIGFFNVSKNTAFGGSITPSTPPPQPDGDFFWIAVMPGVYSNYGGMEVEPNSIAVITRINGDYDISQAPFDLAAYAKQADVEREMEISDDTIIEVAPNLIDKTQLGAGQYLQETGNNNGSLNWISTPKTPFNDDSGEGQPYTLSGQGSFTAGGPRVLFYDASLVFMPGDTILSVSGTAPQTFTRPPGAKYFAINLVNSPGAGSNPSGHWTYNTVFLNRGSSPTPSGSYPPGFYVDYNKIINIPEPPPVLFDTTKIVVVREGSNVLRLYTHGGGANNIWFRVRFVRQNSPSKFVNTWRLDEGDLMERTGENSWNFITRVIEQGVWENAIYTTTGGYDDALGNAHGWEQYEDYSLFIDGKPIDLGIVGAFYEGVEFKAYQSSFLKTFDGTGNVGKFTKQWTFSSGKLIVEQLLQWLGTLGIANNSYLGMCSILRLNGSTQISHTGMSNEEWKPYDISNPGFNNPLFLDTSNPLRRSVVVWGDRIKIQMTADVKEPLLPNNGMFVQNTASPNYNKIYNRFGTTTVNNGDTWKSKTVYKINVQ